MSAALLDRQRLAKLCGLFSSDHPGERANAAAMADSLLRQAGLRWPDVILPGLPRHRPEREIEDNYDAVAVCQDFAGYLTPWEREFLASVSRRPDRLSEKQHNVLLRLVAKCRAAERAAA